MAAELGKREENYEIKYLRKVLLPVDNRIRVPQSLDASSLLPLLDDIDSASLKQTGRRRPRWLSLQSGIAYAAAFTLIVALFYSMEMYKPDMINGGMRIAQSKEDSPTVMVADMSDNAELAEESDINPGVTGNVNPITAGQAESSALSPQASSPDDAPVPSAFSAAGGQLGVGGGGKSTLLLEQGEYEYRCRINDASDPDRTSPVTFEVIQKDSQEFAAQIDITEMTDIKHCFIYGDMLMLIGTSDNAIVTQVYYDPANPARQISLSQTGTLTGARLSGDVAHIVSLSGASPEGVEFTALPHTKGSDACIITAVNLSSLETASKAFTGAKGEVQLQDSSASISYEGQADDGSQKNYTAQILFDNLNIELGTVS